MSYTVEFETRVLGGFPVICKATMERAEPDVGIMGDYADEMELFTLKGKPATFIEKRMKDADWDALALEAGEASMGYDPYGL